MYSFLPAFRKASINLHHHYRICVCRPCKSTYRNQLPRRTLRHFTSPRFLNQEAGLQQSGKLYDITHDISELSDDEPLAGPTIIYEPTGAATSRQTNSRKHFLGLDVLGKPAEIIILQDHEDRHRSDRVYAKGPDNDPKESSALSSSELLEGIIKERGIIDSHQVCRNIEELRQSVITQSSDGSETNGASLYDTLTSKLSSGFTLKQLHEYLQRSQREIVVDPMDLRQDYTCSLYSRSSWQQGHSSTGSYSAPNILPPVSDAGASSRAPPVLKKSANKDKVIERIVRENWQIKPLDENHISGSMDIRLMPIHFDLILSHRRSILRKTSESYGVKIEAFRPGYIIRVSSDFEACADIFRLFKYMIETVEHRTVEIAFDDGQKLDISARTAVISRVMKLTSTIVTVVKEPGPESLHKAIVQIHYMGPETSDMEDAIRILTTATKGSGVKNRRLLWAYKTHFDTLVPSPVDVGTQLALKDQHVEWSRWSAPVTHQPDEGTNSVSSNSPRDTAEKANVLPEIMVFLSRLKPKRWLDTPNDQSPFWKSKLSFASAAKLGQVIFPTSMAEKTRADSLKQKITDSDFVDFKAAIGRSRREFLPVVAGILRSMSNMKGDSAEAESLCITLSPSAPPGSPLNLLAALPRLELEVGLDSRAQQIMLLTARLVVKEAELDVLLPGNTMDIRLLKRTCIDSAAIQDPALTDFVKQSSLDVWGNERVTTPNGLTLRVPYHALRALKGRKAVQPYMENVSEGLSVDYTFTSLEHRSRITISYTENTEINFTIIEAGRTGGRREELSLSNRSSPEHKLPKRSDDGGSTRARKHLKRGYKPALKRKKVDPEGEKMRQLWSAASQFIVDTEEARDTEY